MSFKFLCVVACTLLLVAFFNTVSAADMCYTNTTATACPSCATDICGASVQTSSCCSASDISSISVGEAFNKGMGASDSCLKALRAAACVKCSPANTPFITSLSGGVNMCKSYCLKIKTECDPFYLTVTKKEFDCSPYTSETNCYPAAANSGIINQVSSLAMVCLAVILAVLAL